MNTYIRFVSGHILEKEKLFCYYSKLAKFREPPMDLRPEMIDPFLCTHMVYHYMEFKEETGKIQFDSHEAGPGEQKHFQLYSFKIAVSNHNIHFQMTLITWSH